VSAAGLTTTVVLFGFFAAQEMLAHAGEEIQPELRERGLKGRGDDEHAGRLAKIRQRVNQTSEFGWVRAVGQFRWDTCESKCI
jgi:hypothetical protein